jgi:hypothetical protein
MPLGLSVGIALGGRAASVAGAPVYDPSVLDLSAWFRDYVSGAWSGTASAGTSGSRALNSAADITTTSLDSRGVASLNGTSSVLADTADTLDNYIAAGAYTASLLVRPKDPKTAAGAIYANECLAAENGANWGIAWSASGVALFHYDGVAWRETAWVACSANSWHQVDAKFDGSDLRIRVDGGSWSSPASAGNVAGISSLTIRFGRNYASNFTEMDLAEAKLSKLALSDSELGDIYAYRKARYPSAGLP